MRAVLVLVAAVMFGLAGGYAWSALATRPRHVHVPKPVEATPPPLAETAADREWHERADDNSTAAAQQATSANLVQPASP